LSIYDYGDPGLEWAEADAANDDGQQVIDAERAASGPDEDEVTYAVRLLDSEVDRAQEAARGALGTLEDLTGRLFDVELDGARAASVEQGLKDALRALGTVREVTAARLKEITDAERDAELAALRTENARLKARLGAQCGWCGTRTEGTALCATCATSPDRARYHGMVRSADGSLRFCAEPPGHEPGCRNPDGHPITLAEPEADEPCPIYRPGENGFRWQCMLGMAHNNPDQDPDYDPQTTVHRDQFGNEFRVARCQVPAEHGMPHCWCAVPEHHKPLAAPETGRRPQPETAPEASS
jgi:hypothetical protein